MRKVVLLFFDHMPTEEMLTNYRKIILMWITADKILVSNYINRYTQLHNQFRSLQQHQIKVMN